MGSDAVARGLPVLDPRPAWFDHARCRDPEWRTTFHQLMNLPESRSARRRRLVACARWGCATCPVQPECRAWALGELARSKDRLRGVVGGSTVGELKEVIRERHRAATTGVATS